MTAQVMTANRLLDGEVVFLAAHGWVETIDRRDGRRSRRSRPRRWTRWAGRQWR